MGRNMRFRGGIALTISLFMVFVIGDDDKNIPDSKAESQHLSSIYTGVLKTSWKDEAQEHCKNKVLVEGAFLTFGPPRISGDSSSPYYFSLNSQSDEFTSTITSSSTSDSGNDDHLWWNLDSNHLKGKSGYKLSGKLEETGAGPKNNVSGIAKDIAENCNLKDDGKFSWEYAPGNTTFIGSVTAKNATIEGKGTYTPKNEKRKISYTFVFTGNWDPDSAELDTSSSSPTWPKPGSGGVRSKSSSITGSPSATIRPTTGLATDTRYAYTGTYTTRTTSPYSTRSTLIPTSSSEPTASHSPLGRGGIAGITVGGVSALVGFMALAWWGYKRYEAKKESNRVYPELAYLYTPSPGPYSQSSAYDADYAQQHQGYSSPPASYPSTAYIGGGGMAHPGAAPDWEMREALVRQESGGAGDNGHSTRRY